MRPAVDRDLLAGRRSRPACRDSLSGRMAAATQRARPRSPSAIASFMADPNSDQPVLVTQEVLARLERYVPLAPLHQPNNLAPIRSLLAHRPDLPQVACFDTAFHRGHGAVGGPLRDPRALLCGRRPPLRLSRPLLRIHRRAARDSRAGDRGRARDRCPSRQRRFDVRHVRTAEASKALWDSPRSTACRWGHGPARSILASSLPARAKRA